MCMIDTNHTAKEAQPFIGVILGSISLITVVMNILVLYAVKIEKKLQTVSNLYIISLSCADLIVGAGVMPLNIIYLLKNEWILPKEACKFWLSMDYVASTASIFSLFILCVDRFRSVQQPLKYLKYRTKTRAFIMIVLAWLLSFLWVIPIFGWSYFSQNGVEENDSTSNTLHTCETDFCKDKLFKVLTAVINFYVPSLLMLVFYIKIYKAVRRRYQSQDCINGSFRSYSEKVSAHGGKNLREMQKIASQKASKDVRDLSNEDQKLDRKKRTKPKRPEGSFVKTPKIFHTEGNHFVLKLSSSPQADEQNDMGSPDMSLATVSVEIQNKENTRPQNEEVRKTLNECSFSEQPLYKDSPDLVLELSGVSFTQNATRKDSIGLTYLKKSWQKLPSNSINYSHGLRISRDRKAAKQLGIIMAAFMLCWTPYFISFMIVAFCDHCYNHTVHMFTIWLGYLNSTLNPFIYPLCNENFKKAFKKILHVKS